MKISGAILAGGKSTRMGEDKALIKYRNQTLLGRLTEELSFFDELIVSFAGPREGYALPEGVEAVFDKNRDIGPMEGIRAVLEKATGDYVFVCAVDMPFLTGELVRYMEEFVSSDYDCYVIKDSRHFHPLCAIYSKSLLPLIEELISKGSYRLMELLEGARTKYIDIEKSAYTEKQVTNVNTSDEFFEAALPVVFTVSGFKDSGKTWLISRLINEFIRDGHSVGVIKHDGHDYEMDHPMTDTSVFYEKGAAFTAIFNGRKYSVNARGETGVKELLSFCPETDIVICEGLKHSALPKIFMVRSGETEGVPEGVMGVVCRDVRDMDVLVRAGQSAFYCEDVRSIYDHIKDYFRIKN